MIATICKSTLWLFLLVSISQAASAQQAPGSIEELWEVMQQQQKQIKDLEKQNAQMRQRLQELTLRIEPVTRQQLVRVRQLLADAQSEMAHASIRQVGEHRVSLERLGDRMAHAMAMRRERSRRDLERLQSQLKALSPVAVLERGYSVTRKEDGTIVRSSDEVAMGDRLYTRVASGTVESEVKGTDHGKKES